MQMKDFFIVLLSIMIGLTIVIKSDPIVEKTFKHIVTNKKC